eukprot:g21243.t1
MRGPGLASPGVDVVDVSHSIAVFGCSIWAVRPYGDTLCGTPQDLQKELALLAAEVSREADATITFDQLQSKEAQVFEAQAQRAALATLWCHFSEKAREKFQPGAFTVQAVEDTSREQAEQLDSAASELRATLAQQLENVETLEGAVQEEEHLELQQLHELRALKAESATEQKVRLRRALVVLKKEHEVLEGEKARVYHDEIATLRLELEQIEECYRGLVQKLQENGAVNNYADKFNVQYCDLEGLPDLCTSCPNHQDAGELKALLQQTGSLPWVFQEVIEGGGEAVTAQMYQGIGKVTEFNYARQLAPNFLQEGKLKYLGSFGESWGLISSDTAVVFMDNHDTQRGEAQLTYKNGGLYSLANVFMLAHPYGYPKVMSSYVFDAHDQGPPSQPVHSATGVACGGQPWVCEHRYPEIANMVAWRRSAGANKTLESFTASDDGTLGGRIGQRSEDANTGITWLRHLDDDREDQHASRAVQECDPIQRLQRGGEGGWYSKPGGAISRCGGLPRERGRGTATDHCHHLRLGRALHALVARAELYGGGAAGEDRSLEALPKAMPRAATLDARAGDASWAALQHRQGRPQAKG